MADTKDMVVGQKDENKVVRSEGERTEARRKRERIPLGVPRTKLSVPYQPEGVHLHWVNDNTGRVHQATEGGYEFCTPQEVGLEPIDGEERVKRLVGKNEQGGPLYAYLMKIKQEWYDEDQTEVNKQQDMFEEAVRRGRVGQNELGGAGYNPGTNTVKRETSRRK